MKENKQPIGRQRKIGPVTSREIFRALLREHPSALKLRNQYAKFVSVHTVQRLLVNSGRLGWCKIKREPKLPLRHLSLRLKWTKEMVQMDEYALRE